MSDPVTCKTCNTVVIQAISHSQANPDKAYWRCKCEETSFRGWVQDGEPVFFGKKGDASHNKRRYVESSADSTEAARTRHMLTDLQTRVERLEEWYTNQVKKN